MVREVSVRACGGEGSERGGAHVVSDVPVIVTTEDVVVRVRACGGEGSKSEGVRWWGK